MTFDKYTTTRQECILTNKCPAFLTFQVHLSVLLPHFLSAPFLISLSVPLSGCLLFSCLPSCLLVYIFLISCSAWIWFKTAPLCLLHLSPSCHLVQELGKSERDLLGELSQRFVCWETAYVFPVECRFTCPKVFPAEVTCFRREWAPVTAANRGEL